MDADAMTGLSSRVSLPIVVAIGSALIIAGCSAAPSASGSVIASSSVAVSPSTPASATPRPGLDSTTEGATAAPAGSILVGMAGPPPHFEPKSLSATAGDVAFFLDNASRATHTLAIGTRLYQPLAVSRAIKIGDSAVFTVRGLAAGQYVIWCTISNHAAEGMTGTLTVN
jgi:plastocyanin